MLPDQASIAGQYQTAFKTVHEWFRCQGWRPFDFQIEVWRHYLTGRSGLVHAPTGIGKTYAVWMGPLIDRLARDPDPARSAKLKPNTAESLRVLWITPLKALAADTRQALLRPVTDFRICWSVEPRTGDTPSALRAKQKKRLPTALITTPESLSILLSYPETKDHFGSLDLLIVDEWHELMGSKRGALLELAIAHVRSWRPDLKIWGLSATLGNTDTALEALLGRHFQEGILVRGLCPKTIEIASIIPAEVERFPWAGHLGLKLLPQVLDRIERSKSVLIFTNTRSQAEIWFQAILETRPHWAGIAALHHGSLDKKQRRVVEELLRQGKLKCVVCTSSLDLGVDFSPVDTVIQIGSPKGIARLMQRAGRSGHQPGQPSRVICVPTNALELIEISAARQGVLAGAVEPRLPVEAPLDVLSQHLVTIASGEGFVARDIYEAVKNTYAYRNLSSGEFEWVLEFVTSGGATLRAYAEYCRVTETNGRYRVQEDTIARRHRMNIGTITSDAAINVRYLNGRRLGSIEESFAAKLKRGDTFVFAGSVLQVVAIRDMTLLVKKALRAKGPVPLWLGGRMPLSSELAAEVRHQLNLVRTGRYPSAEIQAIRPLLELQRRWSAIPGENELLIERVRTREGHHVFVYPFEGRLVHEGLAALIAYRISRLKPITLSLAINDYGLELLSDQEIPLEQALDDGLLSTAHLLQDILGSLNLAEMAKRQFREIARIAGLVFQGYPGRPKSSRQLQASSGLLYNVFQRYDPDNLLLKQAAREVLDNQLEHHRLTRCLKTLADAPIRIVDAEHPTPLAFPILADRLRARVSSEKLVDRIRRMQLRLERAAERP